MKKRKKIDAKIFFIPFMECLTVWTCRLCIKYQKQYETIAEQCSEIEKKKILHERKFIQYSYIQKLNKEISFYWKITEAEVKEAPYQVQLNGLTPVGWLFKFLFHYKNIG